MTVHCFTSWISTAYLSDDIIIIVLNVNHLLVGLKAFRDLEIQHFDSENVCYFQRNKKNLMKML